MNNIIVSAQGVKDKILGIRNGEGYKAEILGLKNLSNMLGITKGFPTYFGAVPGSGKTEVLMEILLQLSELHGWKHVILTGETGKAEEIYAKLIHKRGRKPFMKVTRKGVIIDNPQNDKEADENFKWVSEHFMVIDALKIDTSKPFRWDDLIESVEGILNLTDFKYDSLSVDPFYEIDREDKPQTDGQLRALFHKVYHYCQDNNVVVFLTSHIIQMKRDVKLLDGTFDRSEPTAFDFSGGQAWFQKGFNLVTIYRPNVLLDLPDNTPKPNEVWINVRKSKPDGTGKTGRVKWYFDYYDTNRYYEIIEGERLFSRDWIKEENNRVDSFVNKLQTNQYWNEPKDNESTAPF